MRPDSGSHLQSAKQDFQRRGGISNHLDLICWLAHQVLHTVPALHKILRQIVNRWPLNFDLHVLPRHTRLGGGIKRFSIFGEHGVAIAQVGVGGRHTVGGKVKRLVAAQDDAFEC